MTSKEMAVFLSELRDRNEMPIDEDEYYLLGDIADHFMKMVASQPTIEDHPIVWVVSWYNVGEEPVVTVFSNEENAVKYYNHELANGHVKVAIDECQIYNTIRIEK